MSITDKRLSEIQARLEDSEPGPWYHEPIRDCHELTTVYYCFHNGDTWDRDLVAESTGGNVALIAQAPQDLTDLLAEVGRLRDELAKAREVTREKMDDATYAVASVHHPFSSGCLCGYKSARKRDVTEHILDQFIAALGGGDDA